LHKQTVVWEYVVSFFAENNFKIIKSVPEGPVLYFEKKKFCQKHRYVGTAASQKLKTKDCSKSMQ
jgi:hypothetical protein